MDTAFQWTKQVASHRGWHPQRDDRALAEWPDPPLGSCSSASYTSAEFAGSFRAVGPTPAAALGRSAALRQGRDRRVCRLPRVQGSRLGAFNGQGRPSSPTKINKEVISSGRAGANKHGVAERAPSCDRQRSWRCLRDRRTTGFPQIRAARAVRRPFWLDGNACRGNGRVNEPATYGC
jgi:hypothetical protein